MGNLVAIEKKIALEFTRVQNTVGDNRTNREFLVRFVKFVHYHTTNTTQSIDQVIKIQSSEIVRDYQLNLAHLGILFVMDQQKLGRFYLGDVLTFAKMVHQKEEMARENHEQV